MFDWENAIVLHAMQGNRALSSGEGEVSWIFSSCGRHMWYILELQRGCPFETLVCSLKSGTCLGMRDSSGMSTRRARKIQRLLEIKWESRSLFLFDTVILGFLTIFKNCQASSKFEAVNSMWLSSCQKDVRPLFEMRWRPRAFCIVSTGDSDILSPCDMKDEHALNLCMEICLSFESWHLGVHFA